MLNKYRLQCVTEAAQVYQWGETEPTKCPNSDAHTIDPAQTAVVETIDNSPVDPQGAPYVSLLLGAPGLKLCIKGAKFNAPANQTTNSDVSFAETREIQGSWLEVTGNQPGDYVEFKLCLPDGTVIGQFGETVYIPPSGKIDPIVAEGTVSFPAGILVRMSYIAVDAGSVRTVYAWHRLRK